MVSYVCRFKNNSRLSAGAKKHKRNAIFGLILDIRLILIFCEKPQKLEITYERLYNASPHDKPICEGLEKVEISVYCDSNPVYHISMTPLFMRV